MNDKNFKEILRDSFIPSIERMIEKEKEHIENLNKKIKIKKEKRNFFFKIFDVFTENDKRLNLLITSFINESQNRLKDFELKLKQYKDYVKN